MSWDDDDDQANDAVTGRSTSLSAALQDREFSGGSSPPDTVQFSLKEGGQFTFLQGSQTLSQIPSPQGNGDEANTSSITLQLPSPTPINAFMQQTGDTQNSESKITTAVVAPAQAPSSNQEKPQQQQQQQQQQLAPNATTQQQNFANFAQLLAQAQQAGNLLQQANQTQQQTQQPAVQGIQVQQNQNIAQAQPQQVQVAYTADPSTFLQQLQFAQLQQQLQSAQQQAQQQHAAQAQQQASQVQQQTPQQQLPQVSQQNQQRMSAVQFSQRPAASVPIAAAPVTNNNRARAPSSGKHRGGQPPTKKQKTSSKKAAPHTGLSKTSLVPSTSVSGIVSASDTDGEFSKSKSVASKPTVANKDSGNKSDPYLSAEDKAKANRDRNREHARNTRLRKKAYLEKLQATVDELCRERDTLVSERTGAANLLVEMHNTRTEVLMSFFALRSTNEKRRKLWSSILDESCFSCVMPVTPYRSFPASEVQVSKCQRTILGIDAMIADTTSLHVLFDSLVDRSKNPFAKIEFRYTLVTEEAVVAGNQMMARWVMSTTNAVQCGAMMEVAKQGMLCCKFNSAHKIIGLELMFDVMAFMLQLKQAAGSDGFSVIPNTVQTCQRTFEKPMVMTLAEPPFTIIQVNKLWEEMTGYSAEEVVGKESCSILQKKQSKSKILQAMMEEIHFKRPTSAMLVNYKKSGEHFRHFILLFPLSTDSRITHYLSLSYYVDQGDIPAEDPAESKGSILTTQPQNQVILPAPAPVPGPILFTGLQAVSNGPQGQITLPRSHLLSNTAMLPSNQMPPPSSHGATKPSNST